jgi:hypothetical protein
LFLFVLSSSPTALPERASEREWHEAQMLEAKEKTTPEIQEEKEAAAKVRTDSGGHRRLRERKTERKKEYSLLAVYVRMLAVRGEFAREVSVVCLKRLLTPASASRIYMRWGPGARSHQEAGRVDVHLVGGVRGEGPGAAEGTGGACVAGLGVKGMY